MNGAESLIHTLIGAGVEVCFTNPGTSEMHIVAALDRAAEMRCALGLFEGVVSGAADGYARIAGKPACTLLHLGPGLANATANLHNAYRAQVPMVNLVGQHPEQHLRLDAPLTSNVEAIARPYSSWLRTSRSAREVGADAAEAVAAARMPPGQISTLIVPADVAWSEGGMAAQPRAVPQAQMPSGDSIEQAASMLRSRERSAILLGGSALSGRGLSAAGRIAAATGAKLLAPYAFSRMERGAGLPGVDRIFYIFEQAVEQLKEFRQIILVGSKIPVTYFAYPGKRSVPLSEDCNVFEFARPEHDCANALEALVSGLSAQSVKALHEPLVRPEVPTGELTTVSIATVIAALLPENSIIVDESMTSGRNLMAATKGCAPHDWLVNTGGSIGIAMPLALGAAIASPHRRVLCLSADGSGMYTLQALWTMARENLNVTTIVFANRVYGVLKREFGGLGVGEPGPRATQLFSIGHPDLDWVSLAKGMGVPATRATSIETFAKALRAGFGSEGPSLIEVRV